MKEEILFWSSVFYHHLSCYFIFFIISMLTFTPTTIQDLHSHLHQVVFQERKSCLITYVLERTI